MSRDPYGRVVTVRDGRRWIVRVDGKALRGANGGLRRFKTRVAAMVAGDAEAKLRMSPADPLYDHEVERDPYGPEAGAAERQRREEEALALMHETRGCCPRDHDGDGNCDRHPPRIGALVPEKNYLPAELAAQMLEAERNQMRPVYQAAMHRAGQEHKELADMRLDRVCREASEKPEIDTSTAAGTIEHDTAERIARWLETQEQWRGRLMSEWLPELAAAIRRGDWK